MAPLAERGPALAPRAPCIFLVARRAALAPYICSAGKVCGDAFSGVEEGVCGDAFGGAEEGVCGDAFGGAEEGVCGDAFGGVEEGICGDSDAFGGADEALFIGGAEEGFGLLMRVSTVMLLASLSCPSPCTVMSATTRGGEWLANLIVRAFTEWSAGSSMRMSRARAPDELGGSIVTC